MKKLKEARRLVRAMDFDLDYLQAFGYKKIYTDSASSYIYVHYKKRVVVKCPCIYDDRAPKRLRIPSLMFKRKGSSLTYVVQPLATRVNLPLALVRILDQGYGHGDTDVKSSNVAWYRKQPVLIDW